MIFDMYLDGFLFIYSTWILMRFLDMQISAFHQISKNCDNYFFKYPLSAIHPPRTPVIHVLNDFFLDPVVLRIMLPCHDFILILGTCKYLPYTVKGILQIWLCSGHWDGKIVLGYLSGPDFTQILNNREPFLAGQRKRCGH